MCYSKRIKAQIQLIFALSTIAAAQISSRKEPACGGFKDKIVCFGGIQGNSTYDEAADRLLYSLDLNQGGTVLDLANNWKVIEANTNGVNIQVRTSPQFTTISDTQLLISGGASTYDDYLEHSTVVYDISSNSWYSYAQYIEGDYGIRQIYYASSSMVPGKGVAFYGGAEQIRNLSWTTNLIDNSTVLNALSNSNRYAGYTAMTYLDINNLSNTWYIPTQNNIPRIFPIGHTSVYSGQDKRIYIMGGRYVDPNVPTFDPGSSQKLNETLYFNHALYFDTVTNTWGNQTLTGKDIPNPRERHTLTILPNNPDTALLYGGSYMQKSVTDYCYTLNLTSFTWKKHMLEPEKSLGLTNLERSYHAVVLVNETVFILFGTGSDGLTVSVPIVLNVSDVNNITLLTSIRALDENKSVTSSTSAPSSTQSTTSKAKSNSLRTGEIVGIAAGAAAVILIGGIVALFFYIRYRKNEKNRKLIESDLNYSYNKDDHKNDQRELDWDNLETEYVEINGLDESNGKSIHNGGASINAGTTFYSGSVNVPHNKNESAYNQSTYVTHTTNTTTTTTTTTTSTTAGKALPDIVQMATPYSK